MLLHLRYSDPLSGFLIQHASKKVAGIKGDHAWYLQFCLLNASVEFLDVVSVEWGHTDKHLIQDGTHLVYISRLSHTILREHLRRQIGWTSAE